MMGETKSAAEEQVDQALREREKLRLLAGTQIINLSASSVRACDVYVMGI